MPPNGRPEELLAAGGTVITATHRLARQLHRNYNQAQANEQRTAWPTADALPLDAWLRRTWESAVVQDAPLAAARLLTDSESRLLWHQVVADDPPNALDIGVIVPLVASAWRLCQVWGIPGTSLQAAADSDDGRAFARWVTAYETLLRRRGWLDSALLLTRLCEPGSAAPGGSASRIGFAGFKPWTPAVESLATSLRKAGHEVLVLAPIVRAGRQRVVAPVDQTAELAQALRWSADRLTSQPGASVAILVPDLDRDAARIRRTGLDLLAPGWQLREPGILPLVLAGGRALGDYPIIHCALEVLALCLGHTSFEQVSGLLRSVYLTGSQAERAGLAQAELDLRKLPIERVPLRTLLRLLEFRAPPAAGRWQRAEALAASVREQSLPPGPWVRQFTAWLDAAAWPGQRALNSEEFQVLEAWQRELGTFAATGEVTGSLAAADALSLLAEQVRGRAFEPEGVEGAVQILSLQEAEGQDFDALWVCGLTAGQWPPPVRPHPLIPLALQRAAGIPEATPTGVNSQAREQLARLCVAADDVTLSWPAEQEGAETLMSPLLGGFDSASALAAGAMWPAPITTEPLTLHPDRDAIAASDFPVSRTDDPAPTWCTGKRLRGGTRLLSLQAVCPARAFAEFRLRGAPLEAPARPLDAAMRGKVMHQILERLYRLEPCRRGLGGHDAEALRSLFDPVFDAVLDEYLPATDAYLGHLRRFERERVWGLLQGLRQKDTDRPAFEVVTEVAQEVEVGPLLLQVRLDRLDQLDAGGSLVIDYKTGEFTPAGWKGFRLAECQLPLYAVSTTGSRGAAVLELRPPKVRFRGVGESVLEIDGLRSPAKFFQEPTLDWDAVLARWASQLDTLAREFAAGDFRVNPADRKWAVGQFASLTRIHSLRSTGVDATDDPGEPE